MNDQRYDLFILMFSVSLELTLWWSFFAILSHLCQCGSDDVSRPHWCMSSFNIVFNFWNLMRMWSKNVSGYVCNHGSPSGERDTASSRGRYGERRQRDSCLKHTYKNTTCWPATLFESEVFQSILNRFYVTLKIDYWLDKAWPENMK